jgi:hypothetical protein
LEATMMTSPLKQHERLSALFADVERLRRVLVESERQAGELLDGEEAATAASNRVAATRMLLDAAKDLYIAESEAVRSSACPIHGDATLVCCPDCAARNPHLRAGHETYRTMVRASEQAAE